VNALNEALEHTNNVLADAEVIFSENRTDLSLSIESLRESAEHLARFSRLISEDPSVLLRGATPEHAPDDLLENRDENR
jgi:ABC-type transporter Mla subunit MlaD